MGTSSSQRSPSTPEWERVRELYRQPNPDPVEVLSRIVSAIGPETRAGLKGAGVVCCLDNLLEAPIAAHAGDLSRLLMGHPGMLQMPVIELANGIRRRAESEIIDRQIASRFSDLGLQAVGTTVMGAAEDIPGALGLLRTTLPQLESHFAGFYEESRLNNLAGAFLADDLSHAFRYFVARDISDFVGTEALPTVSSSSILQDRIAHSCRLLTGEVDLTRSEDIIRHALTRRDPAERGELLHGFFGQAIDSGLGALAEAGG
jgi:hypothetical protein